MGAIRGHNHVCGRDVAMDDAVGMQSACRFAYLARHTNRLGSSERFGMLVPFGSGLLAGAFLLALCPFSHEMLKGSPWYEVVHDDELLRELVSCLDMRQARAVALGQGRPHATSSQFVRNLLADERTDSVSGDELCGSAYAVGQHAFDPIGIVDVHGVHDLLVVQSGSLCVSSAIVRLRCGRSGGDEWFQLSTNIVVVGASCLFSSQLNFELRRQMTRRDGVEADTSSKSLF